MHRHPNRHPSFLSRLLTTSALGATLFAAALSAGCKKGENAAQLPPAQGAGAPPLPDLKSVSPSTQEQTTAPSEGKTTGTLFPKEEAQLGPQMTGVIADIAVKEGDKIRRGQVLFRLDTRGASLMRDQARTALAGARVQLRGIETEYNRTKGLIEKDAVNRAAWEQVQNRFDGAKIGVEQAQVALAMAEKSVSDAAVKAPFDGVVTMKLKNEGELATMMPPTVVLIVQNQSQLELKFRLPERSLSTVAPGGEITARFEALGAARPAKVLRINPTVDSRTRTFEVVALLDNTDGLLKPGLLAEIDLTGGAPAAPTAPTAAPTAKAPAPATAPAAPAVPVAKPATTQGK